MTNHVLVLLKPDTVRRGLTGQIIARIEAKGYQLVACELRRPTRDLLERHYQHLHGKPYLPGVLDFMTSGPLIAAVFAGTRVIEGVRHLAGATDPMDAQPGTIRGDLARAWPTPALENLIHCSDSPSSAVIEIGLWFPEFDMSY